MENEVYFNPDNLIKVNKEVIESLKAKARANASGKYRLCLQHSPEDKLHEMYIVRSKGNYGRPDMHLYTTESHTIVDGAMLVILFEADGRIREIFELSQTEYQTYRIDTNIYHMQIPLTEQVVYYEVKSGPFTSESNVFPEWAPDPSDASGVSEFMKGLEEKIRNYQIEHAKGERGYDTI